MSKLREMLISEEDVRLYVYDDETGEPIGPGSIVRGHPTLGCGRAVDRTRGISRGEAMFLLENDLADIARQAREHEWFLRLDPVRRDVIQAMIFQLGAQGVREFRKMIAALLRKDYAQAALEMLQSDWAKQTPARARRMAEMMRTGRYSTV